MHNTTLLKRCTGTVLWLGASATPFEAQPPAAKAVPSTPSCVSCRIALTKVVTLGGPDDPLSPSEIFHSVSLDSRGRYYVAPTANFAMIAVYSAEGRFLKTLGSAGQGPGEYEFIIDAKVRSDSLFVLDQATSTLR